MPEIKVEKTVFQNYAEFKVEFGKLPLEKSGENKFQGWKYFELSDFSQTADEYLLKHNLVYVGPTWEKDSDATVWVVAFIYNLTGSQYIKFKVEDEKSNHANNPIQNKGGSITYWRRFMKSLAVDLIENDEVDASDPNVTHETPKVEEKKATSKQVEMIKKLYDKENIAKMLAYYHLEKLEDLSIKIASEVIKRKDSNGTDN